MEAEETPPCPYFNRGHCRGNSNGNCKLSHTTRTCWKEKCEKGPTCAMRHPRSCNLFFRSSRGCHRKSCSHRHLATQEDPTVLVAGEKVAEDDQRINELNAKIAAQQIQMSELHERLAAQEIQTKELLVSISKLGCKLGNTEASFKRLLETQDIKLSGEIGCLDVQVQRNKKTMKELNPPELSNLISEFTKMKTNVNTTMQKVVDEKLKEQDYLHRSDLNKVVDGKLKEYTDIREDRIDSMIHFKLMEYNDIIRNHVGFFHPHMHNETLAKILDRTWVDLNNIKQCPKTKQARQALNLMD